MNSLSDLNSNLKNDIEIEMRNTLLQIVDSVCEKKPDILNTAPQASGMHNRKRWSDSTAYAKSQSNANAKSIWKKERKKWDLEKANKFFEDNLDHKFSELFTQIDQLNSKSHNKKANFKNNTKNTKIRTMTNKNEILNTNTNNGGSFCLAKNGGDIKNESIRNRRDGEDCRLGLYNDIKSRRKEATYEDYIPTTLAMYQTIERTIFIQLQISNQCLTHLFRNKLNLRRHFIHLTKYFRFWIYFYIFYFFLASLLHCFIASLLFIYVEIFYVEIFNVLIFYVFM